MDWLGVAAAVGGASTFWVGVPAAIIAVVFRKPITRLIDRIKSLDVRGVGVQTQDPAAAQQQVQTTAVATPTVPAPTERPETTVTVTGTLARTPAAIAADIITGANQVAFVREIEERLRAIWTAQGIPDEFREYPFENYMGYLIRQGLVQEHGDACAITLKGTTFLLYLVNDRLPQNRVFRVALSG